MAHAFNFETLSSLTLRMCPNCAQFLKRVTQLNHPIKLKRLEIQEWSETFVLDYLNAFEGLEELFVGEAGPTSALELWGHVAHRHPNLKRFVGHQRMINSNEVSPYFERPCDVLDLGISGHSMRRIKEDHSQNPLAKLDLEFIGLPCIPKRLKYILLPFTSKTSLKVLHIRQSASDLEQCASWAINEDPALATSATRSDTSSASGESLSWTDSGPTTPTGAAGDVTFGPNAVEVTADNHGGSLWPLLQHDFRQFLEWAFGPQGIASLDIVAFGDFAHGDRETQAVREWLGAYLVALNGWIESTDLVHWAYFDMAEVAGLALGAVGVVGLIGAFKDTIDLFGLLADSRDLGRDYEILRIKLDIQKTLLLQWTDRVGLLRQDDYDPCLDQARTREAIGHTLSCIRLLLTDATTLRNKYGLDEANDQEGTAPPASVSSISAWRMGETRSLSAAGHFGLFEKQKFEILIRDLSELITSLDKLVPVTSKQPALRNLADDDGTHRFISESAQRIISRAYEEIILNRLWFRKIHERRETVADAHLKTLGWALYPPKDETQWHDLSKWLRNPSTHEVYWISGKAGSGKSTLMKYLYYSDRTHELLRQWSHPRTCMVADFFFFDLGTEEQKSFEGLSRALLYQLLKPNPSLIHKALPYMVNELRGTDNNDASLPSLSEIRYAFRTLTQEPYMQKFCILIDGLDEFRGDIRESVSLIQDLSQSDHIKVLVSSRPIPACVAVYQNLPRLRLQDLTRKDIGAYVKDVIGGHPYMKRLLRRSPDGARSVINQLVDKSSGVFLWVVLACRSLLSGFEDCDRLPELQKRVDELPPELEDFFDLMLAKINQRYQYQGAYLLRLCYESQRASRSPGCPALPNMETLALALIDDADVSADSIGDLSLQDKIDLCTVLEGRLRSRCGGLLETQPTGDENGQLVGGVVVFMHRTVFEYLGNESVWERGCLSTDPQGPSIATSLSIRDLYHMILRTAELDEGKSERFEARVISALRSGLFWTQKGDGIGFFEQLPHFLRALVGCKYRPNDPDLSALVKACHELPGTTTRNYLHAPLILAAEIGARDYMIRNPEFRTLNGPSMPGCGCPPLLSLEFRPPGFTLTKRSRPSPHIVSMLLRSGANPRLRDNVFTPWVLWLQEPSGLTRKDRTDDDVLQAMDVAETMVKYDAGGTKELRKWLNRVDCDGLRESVRPSCWADWVLCCGLLRPRGGEKPDAYVLGGERSFSIFFLQKIPPLPRIIYLFTRTLSGNSRLLEFHDSDSLAVHRPSDAYCESRPPKMPGFEGFVLTPVIIRTVGSILSIYKVVEDTENLPEAFHKVVEKLPLVQRTLLTIRKRIRANAHEEDYEAMRAFVKECMVKVGHLEEIFNAVASWEGTFMLGRYRMAARRLGKVEVLTVEIMQGVRSLQVNRAVARAQARVALLDEAILDLSLMPPSLPDEDLINSGPGNQYMDNHIGYIGSISNFANTLSGSRTVTWIKDVQRAIEIPSLIWEVPWFEQSSRFPVRLPWDPCATKDCVLPNDHLSSHEIWKPCTMQDCSRHRDHEGDHRMRSEELSEINARFEKRAEAAERFWRELADTVLEAMGYPQPEGRWRSKVAKTTIKPFENTRRQPSIKYPSLARGIPSLAYRKFVLENRQIRLFQLHPRTTTSSITGSFICAELSSRPVYTALSYTWGDGGANRKITILNQDDLAIGENLWSFLRLQSSIITERTLFWIDAICIDQANIHERNHQVGLMRQIYTSATKVYVWLGQEDENSNIAMRFVTAQASKPLRPRGSGYHPLWSRREGKALHALCDRRYWRRMWIIQELLHANDITVWCGSLSFTWDDIEKLYLKLKTIEESNWFAHHEYHLMVMQSSAAVMIWQRAHWRHPDTPVPSLQTLIEIFRDWQCTDLRDKVFALSGMATEESTVEPDYALTTREVYFAVLQHIEGQQEQFRALLAQTFGLAGRDVDLHGQNMYSYLRITRCAR
ncbi:hypothetical protein FNAPI_11487 [Fusarium napiforme]|uniref:NACHT domain-containing protein n=1 Tax=Fusarium napiforme TaxID=42672 RepID=A0A8H5MP39_9HYPO|nr:hypothetical protein FNAPI_11487 [Fusarium napiforme]